MSEQSGPPYPPTTAGAGGVPSVLPDIPILGVFIGIYAVAAAGHMATFQINLRKQHKFIVSAALFGFCMARIVTCALRMAWATNQENVSLALAAQIFVNVGILIVYIINLLLSMRILRAKQPTIGWLNPVRAVFMALYACVAISIILLITFITISFYTLDEGLRTDARDVELASLTYLLVFASAPCVVLAVAWGMPKNAAEENFGKDSLLVKTCILMVSVVLCMMGAGFKAGITWEPPRPASDPAWYDAKAPFYVFYFALEIIIVYWLLLTRIDQRFHVPNGSSKVQTYKSPKLTSYSTSTTGTDEEKAYSPVSPV